MGNRPFTDHFPGPKIYPRDLRLDLDYLEKLEGKPEENHRKMVVEWDLMDQLPSRVIKHGKIGKKMSEISIEFPP